jgi:hypothetical protein
LLREILSSRKERKIPTFVTFIDARKAYDTVWRERAYLNIYEKGVRGKLFRQLQRMHSNLTRKVRHPLGLSDSFQVDRGVAQGAIESPWVYSMFVDALAEELRAAGHGIHIGGRLVPLLMYADDIVLFANSTIELAMMNRVATEFARKNRFQFNGEKSGVMAFGVDNRTRDRVRNMRWELFGERVKVVDKYDYLGTTLSNNHTDWNTHVGPIIKMAKSRFADLQWICKQDRGMRPRTCMTLWMSLIRPVLEYASEIWSGQISRALEEEAERIQTSFIRTILGIQRKGGGSTDDSIRAEVGAEKLEHRWAKLKLGYWKRVFAPDANTPSDRLLHVVAKLRKDEYETSGGKGLGKLSWVGSARSCLENYDLLEHWHILPQDPHFSRNSWKDLVYAKVNNKANLDRTRRGPGYGSNIVHSQVKFWGVNPKHYSVYAGEINRIGQYVPEKYLDDVTDKKGTRIKLLCRLNLLPIMDKVGRDLGWPHIDRVCLACNSGDRETIHHFVMNCSLYDELRLDLNRRIITGMNDSQAVESFNSLSASTKLYFLLGMRFGNPNIELRVDAYVKRFLRKAWNKRTTVTEAINKVLGCDYSVKVNIKSPGK